MWVISGGWLFRVYVKLVKMIDHEGVFGEGVSRTAIPGMLWQFSGVVVKALLQIAVLSVLSRLLSPEDFGLIAIGVVAAGRADDDARAVDGN